METIADIPEIFGFCRAIIIVIGIAVFKITPKYFVFITTDESESTVISLMA
jgi:hypothetical protein